MNVKTVNRIKNFCIGIGIGIANVIPGVSGGTIALLTGILIKLLNIVKRLNLTAVKLLFKGRFRAFLKYIHFEFLAPIISGLLIAVFAFAELFKYLLKEHKVLTWALFFGLILASVIFVFKRVKVKTITNYLLFIIVAGITAMFTLSSPSPQNNDPSFTFICSCGVISICGMILPGLSGSYILILLGSYEVMLKSLSALEIDFLAPFVLGILVGFFSFSYVVSWVFKKYHDQTIAVLSGFILGSLVFLWPWKTEVKVNGNLTGFDFFVPEWSGHTIAALFLMVVGFVLIYIVELYAEKAGTAPQVNEQTELEEWREDS